MKIYDYTCIKCDNSQEMFVKSQHDVVKCSTCSNEMKRAVSAPAMVKTNFADKTGFKPRK